MWRVKPGSSHLFLRDVGKPVAYSDEELLKVSKAMLLGLASAEQMDVDKQPYVNAMMHFQATLITNDQP